MASKKSDDKTTIVVVGGGAGGVAVARPLSKVLDPKKHSLILVNPRPYHLLLPATLRLVVSDVDNLQEKVFPSYDKLFYDGNGTFVQASVTRVEQKSGETKGRVVLSNGEDIDYDVLVLATGSKWEGPIAFPEDPDMVSEFIAARRQEFAKAKDIVLVGGGAVGIELSGEIKDIWPNKNVTVLNRDTHLLNDAYPEKYRVGLEKQLKGRGITVITGDSLEDIPEELPESGLRTVKGKTLKADLVVRTWGNRPDTSYLSSSLLTSTGHVKVTPTLQLPSLPNVFALGDIIDWKEQKMAMKASTAHAPIVIANVQSYLAGKDVAKVGKKYKGSPEIIIITDGKTGGMAYLGFLWGIVLGPWFASRVKSKGLMVDMMRSGTGN